MRWCKLDIKKAADVASEVTQVSNELKTAQQRNDSAAVEELRASVEKRIQELKQFYKDKKDHDDRAESFEKQRLRLKGILTTLNKASVAENNGAGKAVQSASGDAVAPQGAPSGAGLLESSPRPSDRSAPTPRPKSPKGGAGAQEGRSPSPKGRPQLGTGEKTKTKHFKPLYKWEMPEGQEARTLKRYDSLSTEYGNFVPGSARGYYERDPSDGEPQGAVDAVLDFQLILTAEEYRTLQARRRGSSKYDRKDEPKLSESIASSTPFLDRWRINAAMYRHATKEKWIVPEGFRIAPKP